MSQLKQRILEVFKGPCLSGLATITKDGTPWVRYVMAEASDDMTFRCSTLMNFRKVDQIAANPEVHLTCGITDPMKMTPYLQIQGRAEVVNDAESKEAFWSDRLKMVFSGPDDPNYGVVVIRPYRIEYQVVGSAPEVWEAD
jgi:general stress protein 26